MKHLEFLKKRGIVTLLFFVLFLLFLSLYFFNEKEKEVIDIKPSYLFEDPEKYKMEERGDKRLVKSGDDSFSFYFPKEWLWENFYEEEEGVLIPIETKGLLLFPFKERDDVCKIYLLSYKEEQELRYLKSIVEREESIKVDNYYGIKRRTERSIHLKIPTQRKIIEIGAHYKKKEEENCLKRYYKVLDSLSFLKKDEN